jgi:hypothetical protein
MTFKRFFSWLSPYGCCCGCRLWDDYLGLQCEIARLRVENTVLRAELDDARDVEEN